MFVHKGNMHRLIYTSLDLAQISQVIGYRHFYSNRLDLGNTLGFDRKSP